MKTFLLISIVIAGTACAPPPKMIWVNAKDPQRNLEDDWRVCSSSADAQKEAMDQMNPPITKGQDQESHLFRNRQYFGCMESLGWDRVELSRTPKA